MNTLLTKTLALGALAFTTAASQAAVLTYGTFTGTTPDTTDQVDSFTGLGGFAVGFSVTHSTTYTLSSASFSLARDTTPGANRNVRLRIFSGALQGDGGTVVFTSSAIAPAGTSTVTTFSGINVTLTSGTTYWLTVDASGGTTGSILAYSAAGTDTAAGSGGGSYTFAGARTTDSSDTFSTANTTAFTGSNIPNFSVTVPEPHEYAMVAGLGLCAFAAYRRRSTRAVA